MEGLGSSLAAKTAGQGASPSYEAVALQSDDRKIVRSIEKDPWNRLHSIVEDSRWVSDVAHHIPHLPLIPNLRCGAWYAPRHLLPPESQASTYCYFKSTDGHANEWSFSLKRPNLGVLQLIQERGGVIIVDSTRRGKVSGSIYSRYRCIMADTSPPDFSHSLYQTPSVRRYLYGAPSSRKPRGAFMGSLAYRLPVT